MRSGVESRWKLTLMPVTTSQARMKKEVLEPTGDTREVREQAYMKFRLSAQSNRPEMGGD